MKVISDFHIHSRFSRATSKQLDVPNLVKYAKIKGLDLLGTGDFTHHLWLNELKEQLKEWEKPTQEERLERITASLQKIRQLMETLREKSSEQRPKTTDT